MPLTQSRHALRQNRLAMVGPAESIRMAKWNPMMMILSAARYCLSDENFDDTDPSFSHCIRKNSAGHTLSVVRSCPELYERKGVDLRDVRATVDVNMHLRLTNVNAEKSFMEL
jgi:hypothetical protein